MLSSNLASFQNIRFPEDPPLAGMPHSEAQSFLLTEQFGSLQMITSDVNAFCSARSSGQAGKVLKDITGRFLKDPTLLEQYFETLKVASSLIYQTSDVFDVGRLVDIEPDRVHEIAQEIQASRTKELEHFGAAISKEIGRYASFLGLYTKESLGEWLRISVKGEEDSKLAKDVLRGLFSSCNSASEGLPELERIILKINKTLDFLYTFGEAVVSVEDPDTRSAGLKMLCFDTDIFPLGSKGYCNLAMSAFAWSDSALQKFMEINAVIAQLARPQFQDAFNRFDAGMNGAMNGEDFARIKGEYRRQCPARYEALRRYYIEDLDALEIDQGSAPPWPDNLVVNSGPLRVALHHAIANQDPSRAAVWMPGIQGNVLTTSQIGPSIFEYKSPEGGRVHLGGQVRTLFYLTPELEPDAHQKLAADLPHLRERIADNISHLISPRGDKMIIVDPELKALGFKWILFERGAALKTTGLTVAVGEYQFEFNLGKDLVLRDLHEKQPFELPFSRNAFLEHLILSHLHELMCTRNIAVNGNKELIADDAEAERKFKGRRPHFRKLQPGRGFTPEQWAVAFANEQELDLNEVNARFGLTRETGQKTFVKVALPDGDYGPFISNAPHSMAWMRELLVSKETATNEALSEQPGNLPE